MKFEEFCGGPLWDTSLTWNTDHPDLTDCFQNSVLIWVPCSFLIFVAPFYYFCYLRHLQLYVRLDRKKSKLQFAKVMLTSFLLILNVTSLVLNMVAYFNGWHGYYGVNVLSPAVQTFTCVISFILLAEEGGKRLVTSGVHFLYYLLCVVAGGFVLWSTVSRAVRVEDTSLKETPLHQLIIFGLYFFITFVLFIIFCFADSSHYDSIPSADSTVEKKRCPEVESSFLSRVLFFWISRFIYLGYKQTLTESDVWSLNPRDLTRTNAEKFEKVWREEVDRCQRHNKKLIENHHHRSQLHHLTEVSESTSLLSPPSPPSSSSPPPSPSSSSLPPLPPSSPLAGLQTNNSINDVPTVAFLGGRGRVAPVASSSDIGGGGSGGSGGGGSGGGSGGSGGGSGVKLKKPSLFKVMMKVFGWRIAQSHLFQLFCNFLPLVGPMLLSALITFIERSSTDEDQVWKGYLYACLFFLNTVLYSILFQQVFHIGMNAGMRMSASIISLVYKKALIMSSQSRKSTTVGEIINLISVDAQRLQDLVEYSYFIWSSPFQIILCLYFLYDILGASVFAGVGAMVLFIPINWWVSNVEGRMQIEQMSIKDDRIKIMNEILNGIKVIKLYAWELSFKAKVDTIRELELKTLKRYCYLVAVAIFSWSCAPTMVTLATFATYVLTGGLLDANKAFTALAYFNILKEPIYALPTIISYGVMGVVSIGRIGKFLQNQDVKSSNVLRLNADGGGGGSGGDDDPYSITIEDGTFAWGSDVEDANVLNNINLKIMKKSLTAVVGQVGIGKSSLLSAMLGDMEKKSGRVIVDGRIGYVCQQAWIENATMRDNILFGKPFDREKYERVIEACALKQDLAMLPAADLTEIGEKGINLSGGQKQRVSLARSMYQDCDVYLLDDPLSAVDSHVARHIFNNVIGPRGMLRDKTRILVTHGITWLPSCDVVVVMATGGIISEIGSYQSLLSHNLVFAQFIRDFLQKEDGEEEDEDEVFVGGGGGGGNDVDEEDEADEDYLSLSPGTSSDVVLGKSPSERKKHIKKDLLNRVNSLISEKDDVKVHGTSSSHGAIPISVVRSKRRSKISRIPEEKKRSEVEVNPLVGDSINWIIQEESSESGSVKWPVYWVYIRSLGKLSAPFLIFFIIARCMPILSNVWLSKWMDDPIIKNTSILVLNQSELYKERQLIYLGGYSSFGLLQALFIFGYAIMSGMINVTAARTLHEKLLTNVLRSPMTFFDTTPIGRVLNRFSKDVETIDNSMMWMFRNLLAHLMTIISTIIIIAYTTPMFLFVVLPLFIVYYFILRFYIPTTRQLKRLESKTRSPIYAHFSESIAGASTIRAFNKQRDFISKSHRLVDSNLGIYFANITSNRWLNLILDSMGGLIVLSAAMFAVLGRDTLSPAIVGLSVSYALQVTIILSWFVEMGTELENAIVSVERVKEYSETPTEADWHKGPTDPPPDWPTDYNISFHGYGLRYRPGLELVLKDINLNIKSGEKVGIVGRTGAGKSSLTLALFRLIEPSEGGIRIDGLDVSSIGLHQLRSKLTILPQDPVIFSGSLRSNLDPTNEHTDEEIWTALDHAHLRAYVAGLPGTLENECGEGGQNLSVGQRQLVCLGRALLHKTGVLVLDEATAAVDLETDKVIQETIRAQFNDCTVLTIAHRINTILNCDRVLVMDQGRVVEFDNPQTLLANKQSLFYGLAKDANVVS